MRPPVCLPALLGVSVSAILASADETATPSSAASPGELSFLEAGKDYVIRFPASHDLFRHTTSGVSETTETTSDGKTVPGKPAVWRATISIEIFRVVRVGGGSWALLEYPARADDFAKWNGKRRAMAKLADERSLPPESDPEGKEKVTRLHDAASAEIPTARTWVNLDHALAIADVPTEDVKLELKIKSIDVKSDD